jgi:hypothetical protein
MNTPTENIAQVVQAIGQMQAALEALSRETLPVNPRLFAVMAEGPVDQMRDLLNQLDALTAVLPGADGVTTQEQVDVLLHS